MKWIVFSELAFTVLLFGAGIYSTVSARSADEGIIASVYYLGGATMIGVLLLTLLGWWGWTVTFRG